MQLRIFQSREISFSQAVIFKRPRWTGCHAATRSADKMTKPIVDKAEVALEYPDKFYTGTFERSSRFRAAFDKTGVLLVLERPGSEETRRSVHIHINYGLFADILQQLSSQAPAIPADEIHLDQLRQAAAALDRALKTAVKC
jgi:hypothetical protein